MYIPCVKVITVIVIIIIIIIDPEGRVKSRFLSSVWNIPLGVTFMMCVCPYLVTHNTHFVIVRLATSFDL